MFPAATLGVCCVWMSKYEVDNVCGICGAESMMEWFYSKGRAMAGGLLGGCLPIGGSKVVVSQGDGLDASAGCGESERLNRRVPDRVMVVVKSAVGGEVP